MSEGDFVNEGQCSSKTGEIHARVTALSEAVSQIKGWIAACALFAGFVVAIASGYINHRFANIEKTLDKIDRKVSVNMYERIEKVVKK